MKPFPIVWLPANDGDPSKSIESHGSTSGGGGGDDGKMEGRVAKLEAGVEHLSKDVTDVRSDMKEVRDRLARLEERVSHLPSKGFIVTVVVVALTVLTGLTTIAPRIASTLAPPTSGATAKP
jgi:hypothetical protein